MRQSELLKQQNQALLMYRDELKEIHALWAVESMTLIGRTLKFETKILDIAYLILVKLMKEPNFSIEIQHIDLFIKVLVH